MHSGLWVCGLIKNVLEGRAADQYLGPTAQALKKGSVHTRPEILFFFYSSRGYRHPG